MRRKGWGTDALHGAPGLIRPPPFACGEGWEIRPGLTILATRGMPTTDPSQVGKSIDRCLPLCTFPASSRI